MTSDSVAIVGIGCLFPKANGLAPFWVNLRDGIDAIADVPPSHWRPEDYFDEDPGAPDRVYARRGGFVDPVDVSPLELGVAPRDIESTDTTQLLALHVAAQALADAGYGPGGKEFDRSRASVVLGVTGALELVIPLGARLGHPIWRRALREAGVDAEVAEDVVARIADSYVPWQENSFPGLLGNVAAGRIANRLDLHGTNCVVDAACASSLSAMHLAVLELQSGRSDLVLAGGVDTFNDVFMYTCFSKTPALSPTGDARPFARDADGTILGEGVGIVVLKRLDAARRDGDRVYAILKGIGSSSDGKGQAIYAPDSEGQARALRDAYRVSGVDPSTIGLVEAHGTGTKVGDATEIRGLTSVFDPEGTAQQPWCTLGSVKSMIGHTKAAAGIAGLIKATMALHHRVLPPTIKVERPNDAIADASTPFSIGQRKRPWLASADHPRRAGVSAFGFGGSNFHAVLEEADPADAPITWDGKTQLLAFSGATRAALAASLEAAEVPETWPAIRAWAGRTRASFEASAACRVCMVVHADAPPTKAWLKSIANSIRDDARQRFLLPKDVAFGEGPAVGKLAGLFPGQGSQRVSMLGDLACDSALFSDGLHDVLGGLPAVAAALYPPQTFDEGRRRAQQAELTRTAIAQPALGAVGHAAWQLLMYFGVSLDAAVGHSYGELVALAVAGSYDAATLAELSRRRGEAMAQGQGDRGAMLAVLAAADELGAQIERHGWTALTIANRNTPRQHVLSGSTSDIDVAERVLGEAGIGTRRLDVAAAFHSPLVADARIPFANALAEVSLATPRIPVYANATAEPYGESEAVARTLLADQLVSPVRFVECIERMVVDGVGTFVEIGPGRTLCGLVEKIAGDAVATVAVDGSAGGRRGLQDLAATLGALAAWGHDVALSKWDPQIAEPVTDAKLTVSVCGANAKPNPVRRPPRTPTPMTMTTPPAPVPPNPPEATTPVTTAPAPRPVATAAPSTPAPRPVTTPNATAAALEATQANLAALMRLQEQTAELHRRFLEGQQQATQAFGTLVAQQHALFGGQPVDAAAFASPPALTPVQAPPQPTPLLPAPTQVHAPPRPAPVPPVVSEAPPPPASAPQPVSVPEASPPGSPKIATVLLELVADKTGYPIEMLELSMGMDADLGIDSIKRVEILSGLRERLPEAPTIGPEQLGQLQTLGEIVEYLGGAATVDVEAAAAPDSSIATTLLETVADKTGYPVEMLELSMGMDADLGIDSIKRVEILSVLRERLPHAPAIGPEQLGQLQTLGEIVAYLGGTAAPTPAPVATKPATPVATASEPAAPLDRYDVVWSAGIALAPKSASPAGAVVVTGPDSLRDRIALGLERQGLEVCRLAWGASLPADVGMLVVASPERADATFVRDAFLLVQRAASALRTAKGRLIMATTMGGTFGLEGLDPSASPEAGAMAGLVKTLAREWPEVDAHALDLPCDPGDDAIDAVLGAALGGGPVEIGYADALGTPAIAQATVAGDGNRFGPDDVVVMTGGARGVTAAAAIALAQRGQPTLVLLGRTPPPQPEPAWLAPAAGEREIKQALLAHADEKPSPRALGERCRAVLAAREITATLAAIEAAGSRVAYRAVDVRDRAAVASTVDAVTREFGDVTGLVHGAGVLADKHFVDKTGEDFDAVYGTKVEGAHNLLAALGAAPLSGVVFFSSSTARFGRRGQADYAMANEVLNKLAQQLRRTRPGVRTIAIGWGPWDGGMVTPELAAMFRAEGVGTIPLAAGAELLVSELGASGPAEVVVVGAGSRLEQPAPVDRQTTVFERQLGVDSHHFLNSHVVGGKAVLPTVMMLEWFAHAALAEHPGLRFVGADDLRVFRGIRLGRADRLAVRVEAGPAEKSEGQFIVPVALCSGGSNGHRVVHAQAKVVLATTADVAPSSSLPRLPACADAIDAVYERTLFHGEAFRGLRAIDGLASEGIVARTRSAPKPRDWMQEPVRRRWITDPLAVDSGLQAVIVWTSTQAGAASLPHRLGRYRQFAAFPDAGARVGVRVVRRGDNAAVADLDWVGDDGRLIARMTDCEYTLDAGLSAAFHRNVVE